MANVSSLSDEQKSSFNEILSFMLDSENLTDLMLIYDLTVGGGNILPVTRDVKKADGFEITPEFVEYAMSVLETDARGNVRLKAAE